MKAGSQETYERLRKTYPGFIYKDYTFSLKEDGLSGRFFFSIPGLADFSPSFHLRTRLEFKNKEERALSGFVFHMGLIELISYWKAVCSPDVVILCGHLTDEQAGWWKDIYYNGLGEFFFRNGIQATRRDFLNISSKGEPCCFPEKYDASGKILVPVGGGKDSSVTLGLLRKGKQETVPFMVNPSVAMGRTVVAAGSVSATVVAQRTLDRKLLELNEKGFLNGHTPFSAMLAFYGATAAYVTGISRIALSNESSANEATIPGTGINHQYSKSFDFEKKFRDYSMTYLSPTLDYFSFLRPLSELQIAKIFSELKPFHSVFRSCNVGSKSGSWCGKCPKCLFTDIILSPFLDENERKKIFGKNLQEDDQLTPVLDELAGNSEYKPFECVGTIDEVRLALSKTFREHKNGDMPSLLRHFAETTEVDDSGWQRSLRYINREHHVPDDLLPLLTKALSI